MVNYENGKIYKIVCDTTGDTYYGSTTMPLYKRKSVHKNRAKIECYTSSKIINGGNWRMVLVESYSCKTKEELFAREQHYIENYPCVNKCIPKHTDESRKAKRSEYREANKEVIAEKAREYREVNKEALAERGRKYREGEKREELLQKKREYHHANKEVIAEKAREYREANKEAIAEKKKEVYLKDKADGKCDTVECECGGRYIVRAKARHMKTARHQQIVNNK